MDAKSTPRIALMISGLPRQWRRCLPTQLALFQNYAFDVFFHFWDVVDEAEKEEIVNLLQPRAHQFETPRDFSAADSDPLLQCDAINIPSRMFSQYYSWRNVARLVEPYLNDYTHALRSRSDLNFVYGIEHIIPQLKPGDILLNWWNEKLVLSDVFALGGMQPIYHFHTLYDHLHEYASQILFNPEALLSLHLHRNLDIHIYTEGFQYCYVRRAHMDKYTDEQALRENPGRNKWLDPEIFTAHKNHFSHTHGEPGVKYVNDFRLTQVATLVKELAEKSKNGLSKE